MLPVLRNRTYRHLFAAQVVALTGTGLATVALGLLAYDLAGPRAGSVLGTALAIKMVAYVAVAPAVGALAHRLPRRALMAGSDLARAAVALSLPFVDRVWQVYLLVFLLQAASAAFTPTFQAVIPDVLPDERDYTRALSLSRLAYDLESLFSPALAAALLAVTTYDRLFLGTVAGFLASAVLVLSAAVPRPAADTAAAGAGRHAGHAHTRAAAGMRLLLAAPPLRALLLLNLAVAAAGSLVAVNTVVYVRDLLGRGTGDVALALGAYGAGSMAVALALPRLLDRVPDRTVMLRGGAALAAVLAAAGALTAAAPGPWRWPALLAAWAALGAAGSAVLTPAGRLVRRAVPAGRRTEAFAAQFSLSHAGWLLTYPLAGWVGATAGLTAAAAALGVLAAGSALAAAALWCPAAEPSPEPSADAAGEPARPGPRPEPAPVPADDGAGRLHRLLAARHGH
ncbi:MFS transporter [Streptomyces globosus]|uniref:Multidrug efflux pump Tap n=1 Tax=Streptomyces globosus TaxID=68209 RepID=A0A344TYQ3_9ACTN|nr:MFS transporter [Streptomyces globosus]AXE23774.1 MFS transporter [Streptomyces globosus]